MVEILSIASSISTPLSVVALVMLGLFALYKLLLEKVLLTRIGSGNTYRLIQSVVTYLFVLALVLGSIGLLGFFVVAIFNGSDAQRLAETEQHSITQLSSASLVERQSAIAMLLGVAVKAPGSGQRVCNTLATFVRERTTQSSSRVAEVLPADTTDAVQAIATLVKDESCKSADLSRTDLRRIVLSEGSLAGTSFRRSWLGAATLNGMDLRGAEFLGANLDQAQLRQARLDRAEFGSASFRETDFTGASLVDATGLAKTDLDSAQLVGAKLDGVDLSESLIAPYKSMGGASLVGTNLSGVDLSRVTDLCRSQIEKAAYPPAIYPLKETC